jgi:hypothetical protein
MSGSFNLALFFAVSLMPVYLFQSGGIQPAHLLAFIFAAAYTFKEGLRLESWSIMFMGFVVYTLVIEGVYSMLGDPPELLLNSGYFFFNFFVSQAIFAHVERHGLRPIVLGTIVAAMIATTSVVSTGIDLRVINEGGRETGPFNNPNQLGFFSVCLLSMTYLIYVTGHLRFITSIVLFGCALLLSIISLSKAAIIANALIMFITLKPKLTLRTGALWSAGVLATILVLARLYTDGYFDDFLFIQRIQNFAGENDSSLANRGYFSFFNANSIQLFFGLGSFNTSYARQGYEVHSTLASVLSNYGVFGVFVFTAILITWSIRIFHAFGISGLLSIVVPSMLYGLTHNGTRFMFFWVLFAASLAMANRRQRHKTINQQVSLTRLIHDAR